jgi:predicted DNA-binding transcriptional regulator AlpA
MAKATNPTPADLLRKRIVRPAAVAEMLGVSLPTIYRMSQRGELSRPLRISKRVSGWPLPEIERLIKRARQ